MPHTSQSARGRHGVKLQSCFQSCSRHRKSNLARLLEYAHRYVGEPSSIVWTAAYQLPGHTPDNSHFRRLAIESLFTEDATWNTSISLNFLFIDNAFRGCLATCWIEKREGSSPNRYTRFCQRLVELAARALHSHLPLKHAHCKSLR